MVASDREVLQYRYFFLISMASLCLLYLVIESHEKAYGKISQFYTAIPYLMHGGLPKVRFQLCPLILEESEEMSRFACSLHGCVLVFRSEIL
jgi:hypothetical protein